MFSGGQNLRALREQLGLTMRDVEGASAQIAEKHESPYLRVFAFACIGTAKSVCLISPPAIKTDKVTVFLVRERRVYA